jgi:hypothetical protein
VPEGIKCERYRLIGAAASGLRTSYENEIVFVMKHPCEWRFKLIK